MCDDHELCHLRSPFFKTFDLIEVEYEINCQPSWHLMSNKNSLLLQGFLGGFISSTTVFMQLNYDLKFKSIDKYIRAQALLLAICSMLIESILIVIIVTTNFSIKMLIPLIVMLICIALSIFVLFSKLF